MSGKESLQLSLGGWGGTSSHSRTRNITQGLIATGCPYLEGMEESVVQEVVFSTSEARLRIIQWLVGRFHPQLQELLFTTDTSTLTTQRLTALLTDMGLCTGEDYELVRGNTSLLKQQLFLEALLDLVGMARWDSLNVTDSHASLHWKMEQSWSFMDSLSVHHKMEQSCLFLDSLCRCENLAAVFPHSVALLPPDIGRRWDPGKTEEKHKEKRVPVPSLTELRSEMEEMKAQLEERQTHLEELSQTTYADLDPLALESYYKTLTVSLGTLAQLVTSLCACYEAELRPWTNRLPPQLSGLGQVCRRVHVQMFHVTKLLNCLQQAETSLANLKTLRNPPLNGDTAKFGELCSNAQEAFRDCLAVMGHAVADNSS